MPFIDLNSDVGESFGNWTLGDDAAVFRYVSSANVACGFHGGDRYRDLQALTRAAGSQIKYVKPHGALYNAVVRHEVHAQAVAAAVRAGLEAAGVAVRSFA